MEKYCCDKAYIEHTQWQGEPAVHFYAGGFEALIIPGIGANLIELKDMKRGLNILRMPPENLEAFKARPQVYGIPVLFPPNRIEDGTFTVEGREYRFKINNEKQHHHLHGFLRTRPWMITKMEVIDEGTVEVEASFAADSSVDFFTEFPHQFLVKLLYRLSSKGLEQKISIINKSDSSMPMGLGYHTAFNIPFHPESRAEDYKLIVSVGEKWELNDRTIPTGKLLALDAVEQELSLKGIIPQGSPFEGHYTAKPIKMNNIEFHGAIIKDTSKNIKVIYEVDKEYKHWVIWNETGDTGFICPEPQTWVINAPNLKLSGDITGFKLLAPGEEWIATTRIFVQET